MHGTSPNTAQRAPGKGTAGGGPEANVFALLSQVLRAYQLYGTGRPHSAQQIEALRRAFVQVWQERTELAVLVGDATLRVDEQVVYESSQRSDSLAFLLYKESIRKLCFQPGFESEELDRFVTVMHRSRYVRAEEDDLLTLFWDEDFVHLRYEYVEVGEAGGDARETDGPAMRGAPTGLAHVLAQELRMPPGAVAPESHPQGAVAVDPEPLQASAHVAADAQGVGLGTADAAALALELSRERSRDVERDVVNALLDVLEDGTDETRSEALQVLEHLVPRQIESGSLGIAVHGMRELGGLAEKAAAPVRRGITRLLEQLAALCSRETFWADIDTRRDIPAAEDLRTCLAALQGEALALLLQRAESSSRKPLCSVLEEAAAGVAQAYPQSLADLVPAAPPPILRGALRLASRLGRGDLAAAAVPILRHPDARLRLAAAECIVTLGTEPALRGLVAALADASRDVRLAAAWGLGAWAFEPAAPALESILAAPGFEAVPLHEKSAFLVGYARAGGERARPYLIRLLHGRNRLWRKRPSEVRACAAHALGTYADAASRAALEKAARDGDPAVRTAAQRALDKGR